MPKFRSGLCLAALSVLAVSSVNILTAGPALAADCVGGMGEDYDGDGVRDVAVGDSLAEVSGVSQAGALWLWESRTGSSRAVTGAKVGLPAQTDLHWGKAVASYDADGDGCGDLVVGAPGHLDGSGAVVVIPGSVAGLDIAAAHVITQDTAGYPGTAEAGDEFGFSVAAGSTLAGAPYLAVGAPGEKNVDGRDEGVFLYQRGDSRTLIHQDSAAVPGLAEPGDRFGAQLAATGTHLAVTVAGEDISADVDTGQIDVFRHPASSGAPSHVAAVHQDSATVSGGNEDGDGFGASVAGQNYRSTSTGTTGSLFAVGVPTEDLDGFADAGSSYTLAVPASGTVSQVGFYHQGVADVFGNVEAGDEFGTQVRLGQVGAGDYATPGTAMLSVMVFGEVGDYGQGATQVFRLDTAVGAGEVLVDSGQFGLPAEAFLYPACLSSSTSTQLLLGSPDEDVYGLSWEDLRAGQAAQPVTLWNIEVGGYPDIYTGGCDVLL